MNRFLLILLFIFFTVDLSAYSKKIILASFSSQERAQKMKDSLPQRTPTLYKMTKKYDFKFVIRKSGKYHMLSAEVFTRSKALDIVFKEAKKRFRGAYYNNQTSSLEAKKEVIEVEAVKVETVEKDKIIVQRKIKTDLNTTLVENNTTAIEDKNITLVKKEIVTVEDKNITLAKKETVTIEDKNTTVLKVEKVEPAKPQEKPIIKRKALITKDSVKDESSIWDYFHWSYLIMLIIAGILTHYFIKFKKIYDEY
ncbi:hypothetical protein [Sulfurimonas sp.]